MKLSALILCGASMLAPVVLGAAIDIDVAESAPDPKNPSNALDAGAPQVDANGPHPPIHGFCAKWLSCSSDEQCRAQPDCIQDQRSLDKIHCGGLLFFPHSCWYNVP
ncbi:hypothetical protein GX51_07910 [Blastomyces parvus]|uniref:Uncharacterized protein n=1 Tax=Blastomyces parvus TaxID=2060905 RepID=A0A2B7W9Q0_9EURO|nr:hypothetical protein GX51_07910 [Blastomyces parvus]